MKKIVTLIFFLVCYNLCIAQTWTCISDSITFGNIRIDDVTLINDSTGIYVTNSGYVVKFENYAKKQKILNPNNTFSYCRSVEFFNDSVGFVGTLNNNAPLMATFDGAKTWINLKSKLGPNVIGICGLDIIGDSVIMGVGKFRQSAYFIRSIDLGNTWEVKDLNGYARGLIDVEFIDSLHGFVSGYGISDSVGGVILYTENGGKTWQVKLHTNTIYAQSIWKLQNLNNKVWFGSVESYPNNPIDIVKSIDSGKTWNIIRVDSSFDYMQMVGFIDENHGWTGGRKNVLFETKDGGLTWNKITVCTNNLDRFQRVNDSLAYMTGKNLVVYNKNKLLTGINRNSEISDFHELIISPNPIKLNSEFRINIKLDASTYVELGIVDMQGKLISKLTSEIYPKNSYEFKLLAGNQFKPGVYTVFLYTNEGMTYKNILFER